MGDKNPIRTLGNYSKPSHEGYRNTIELPVGNNAATALPQDVPSTSERRLIELENQVQRLMEAHLAPTQPTQVNKIITSCEISSGPHDTQYCMKDPEQAFVEYASSRTDEAGAITDQIAGTLPRNMVKNPKLSTTLVLSARSYPTENPQCSSHIHSSINAITIHLKQPEESQVNEPDVEQEEGNLGNTNSNLQPDPLASIAT
ncbi:hypothetical protein Tco_1177910 [Tanacetum coccineum]